jgi:hypothetical protein
MSTFIACGFSKTGGNTRRQAFQGDDVKNLLHFPQKDLICWLRLAPVHEGVITVLAFEGELDELSPVEFLLVSS